MRIGLYSPYLTAYGGGEKYIGKLAETFSKDNDVSFIVSTKPDFKELEKRLNIDLSKVKITTIQSHASRLPDRMVTLKKFVTAHKVSKFTINYDLFINQEHLSPIPSLAERSILICQIPPTTWSIRSRLTNNLLTNSIYDLRLKSYDKIIVYSLFTKKWAEKYYEKEVEVLNPPVDTDQFLPATKVNYILSVGRFFTGGHCKKQIEMIKVFKELYKANKEIRNWEYHLIGGVSGARSKEYVKKCQEEARDYPVYFHINAPFEVLKELYGMSKIFWHATGLGEDEDRHPERMEHFGITTVEAMSAGCVPIVINKGGQPEIVRNGIDGFLWNDVKEFKEYTIRSVNDNMLWQKMSQSSMERSRKFGSVRFINEVDKLAEEEKNKLEK